MLVKAAACRVMLVVQFGASDANLLLEVFFCTHTRGNIYNTCHFTLAGDHNVNDSLYYSNISILFLMIPVNDIHFIS